MRIANPPPSADLFSITIRWLFLIVITLWIAINRSFNNQMLVLITVGIAINTVATYLAFSARMTQIYRIISVAGDLIVSALILFYSGTPRKGLIWISFLPLATASFYFQWLGVALITILNLLVLGWMRTQGDWSLREISLIGPLFLFGQIIIGLILASVSQGLRKEYFWPTATVTPPLDDHEYRRDILDLISALSSTLNYNKVLETSLDLSAQTLAKMNAPVDTLVGAVLLHSGDRKGTPALEVAASRRLLPTDKNVTLPGTSGLIKEVIEEGPSRLIRNPKADPELTHIAALHQCSSAYLIPLQSGLDAYGLLVFGHPNLEFFTPERTEVLDIVGNQSVIALKNASLYRDLEIRKNRLLETQEESRRKLAVDLHDGPTQSVSAIAMRVNFARRLMERNPKLASEELYKIEELARRTSREIRHMLFTLRPLVLESQGLAAALVSMAEKIKETFEQDVSVQIDQRMVQSLDSTKQAVMFYLAEEAVNNARKHAQAKHIWVRLKMLKNELCLLEVKDDGIGFDISYMGLSYEGSNSLGMINLRERSELINGILHIESTKGRGTSVQVVIPLTEEAVEKLRRRK